MNADKNGLADHPNAQVSKGYFLSAFICVNQRPSIFFGLPVRLGDADEQGPSPVSLRNAERNLP
jgi:hypothetical protein